VPFGRKISRVVHKDGGKRSKSLKSENKLKNKNEKSKSVKQEDVRQSRSESAVRKLNKKR